MNAVRLLAACVVASGLLAPPTPAAGLTVDAVEVEFVNVKGGDGERNDVLVVRDGDDVLLNPGAGTTYYEGAAGNDVLDGGLSVLLRRPNGTRTIRAGVVVATR